MYIFRNKRIHFTVKSSNTAITGNPVSLMQYSFVFVRICVSIEYQFKRGIAKCIAVKYIYLNNKDNLILYFLHFEMWTFAPLFMLVKFHPVL